jgi:hypothetical protein
MPSSDIPVRVDAHGRSTDSIRIRTTTPKEHLRSVLPADWSTSVISNDHVAVIDIKSIWGTQRHMRQQGKDIVLPPKTLMNTADVTGSDNYSIVIYRTSVLVI